MARKPFVTLDGFEELVARLTKAGRSADAIAGRCAEAAAGVCHQALVDEMRRAQVDGGLIDDMPKPDIEREGNKWHVRVGFRKDESYDPDDPAPAYKAIFLNYGTPHRQETGQVKARGFVKKARKRSRKGVKEAEEAAFARMLEEAGL